MENYVDYYISIVWNVGYSIIYSFTKKMGRRYHEGRGNAAFIFNDVWR